MSYDVYAGKDSHNITYNLARFFKDFDAYPPDWDGKPRGEVADRIDAALMNIRANQGATRKPHPRSPPRYGGRCLGTGCNVGCVTTG